MPKYSDEKLIMEYMQDAERDKALEAIKGKSFKEIKELTGINDDYYLKKILSKLIPMSGYVYYKIIPEMRYNSTFHYCARCEYRLCSLKNVYCSVCDDKRFSREYVNKSEPDYSLVGVNILPFAIGKNKQPDSYGERN